MVLSFLKALIILAILVCYFKTAFEILIANYKKNIYRVMALALITFVPVIGLMVYWYMKKQKLNRSVPH
jgi:hypothetical protein